jgi:formate dehydrogenase gamma subunit
MKIGLKRRSARWTASFFFRGTVLMGALMLLMNAGYLAAQAALRDPNDLWRQTVSGNLATFTGLHDSPLLPSFAIAMAAFVVVALGHFFSFGPKDMSPKDAKDLIPWWTLWERILHGVVAISFLLLMVSGLQVTYGRFFGGGSLTLLSRQIHEFAGFVYTPAVAIMVLIWIKHALFQAYDLEWMRRAGGYLGYKGQVKSGKFNAGQKFYYWVVVATAAVHVWTGLSLYFQWGNLSLLRLYVVLHLIATVPMVLMFIIHVYLSAFGTRGVFMSMIHGKFSRTAAAKYYSEAPEMNNTK